MHKLTTEENRKLEDISISIRRNIIKTSFKAKIPHLGSCLSCVEILVYLIGLNFL